jgi:hypothetical protein
MTRSSEASDLLRSTDISLRVTGIGSVPFDNAEEACATILKRCPAIPYVPQLMGGGLQENMFLQFSENLPCLAVDHGNVKIFFDETQDKKKLVGEFYRNLEEDLGRNRYERFGISRTYSQGLPIMLKECKIRANPFIKTQVTGPVIYLFSLCEGDKRPLIYDDEFSEAITYGLAMKGLWQAREIRKIGKTPLLFFDEPCLSDLGSAYAPIDSKRAWALIDGLLGFIKDHDPDLLVGLHCCGNTDWGAVLESGFDIVSFDAFSCGDKFSLYPGEIKRFLEKGGFIAFGIVPTSEYGEWTAEKILYDRFVSILARLEEEGIPRGEVLDHTIFTPACGMGPLRPGDAGRVMELVASLAGRIRG